MSNMCANCFTQVEIFGLECKECGSPLHKECTSTGYCDSCAPLVKKYRQVDIEIPDVIRRSHIEKYRSCPHSLYLSIKHHGLQHNNEGDEDEDGSIYALIGRDLHELFDFASRNTTMTRLEMINEYREVFECYNPSHFPDQDFRDKMWNRAMDNIEGFYAILDMFNPVPFQTEQNIIFSIGEGIPKVSITMDRIDEVDGELEIHDYKTGKVMTGKKFTTDLQAPLYIYAIREHYKKPVRSFTLHYTGEKKARKFEKVTDDEYVVRVINKEYKISITEAIREVKSLFSKMMKGDFNIPSDVKSLYFTCKMCEHKQTGLCQGAEQQSWHNYNKGGETNGNWNFS